jgi:hypothetical protein
MSLFRAAIALLGVLFFSVQLIAADSVIARPNFNFHFDNPIFVQTADSALEDVRRRLIVILDDSLDYRADIFIAESPEDFQKAIGAAFPDWGAAAALPYRQLIAIKSPAHFPLGKSLRELLQHEYAHLALADRLRPGEAPRWLDEGVAMFISSEWGWSDNINITRAVLFNSLIPFREIEQLNRFSEGKAQIAYSQSYLAVKYLLDSYGKESFNLLLDELKRKNPTDRALMSAIGSGYDGFEKEFFESLRKRYTLMTFFSDTFYFWLALALLVVVGFILGYRKKRRYYKKWEEEDRYQSRDFDYGDPDNMEEADDEDEPWR